jgi:hypothetical protein
MYFGPLREANMTMKLLRSLLAALLVLAGLALIPMCDLGIAVAMPEGASHAVSLPWLLPTVRLGGGICLFAGILVGWKTWRRPSSQSGPPK